MKSYFCPLAVNAFEIREDSQKMDYYEVLSRVNPGRKTRAENKKRLISKFTF